MNLKAPKLLIFQTFNCIESAPKLLIFRKLKRIDKILDIKSRPNRNHHIGFCSKPKFCV